MKSDGTEAESNPPPLIAHPEHKTHLYLIRHGETEWNREGRMQGHEPVSLNALGREQVAATASALARARIGRVIASPIRRAVESAEVLCAGIGVEPSRIVLHPGLAEFDMGRWVGRTFMELWGEGLIQSYWEDPTHTIFPGGESMAAIQARAVAAVNALVAEGEGGRVALVTHGGIVRLLLLSALGMPRSHYHRVCASNASVSHVELVCGLPPRVQSMNVTYRVAGGDDEQVS